MHFLLNEFSKGFFVHPELQGIVLRFPEHHRTSTRRCQQSLRLHHYIAHCDSVIPWTQSRFLTETQEKHVTKMILNDYSQKKEMNNLEKLMPVRVFGRFRQRYDQMVQWFRAKQDPTLN
jgi:hypothetical protein